MLMRLAAPVWALSLLLSTAVGAQPAPHADHARPAPVNHGAKPVPTTNQPVLDAHTREDMERHATMARAHSQAAQCLGSGQAAEQCQKQLQLACKGLALGKNCGMRHSH